MSPEEAATAFLLQGQRPAGLLPSHFTDPDLRAIWHAAEGVDTPSVGLILEKAKIRGIKLSQTRLATLEWEVPGCKPEEVAGSIIESTAHRRAHAYAQRYLEGDLSLEDLREVIQESSSAANLKPKAWASLSDAIGSALDRIKDGVEIGIPNPYPSLRPYIGDLADGNLVVMSGYTGHGKTAFAINLALRIAEAHRVNVISLEMTQEELAFRAMAVLSGIPIHEIRYNLVPEGQRPSLVEAVQRASGLNLQFDDTPSASMDYVETVTRQDPPDLLIVDHLHLMAGGASNRTADIGDMARRFKLLAMELRIPIILLAQLRKVPAGERVREPGLDDLRDSAEIQQSANAVVFVYQKEKDEDLMEILVKKNRSGPVGGIQLNWEPGLTRLTDPVQAFGSVE